MCGRIALHEPTARLARLFHAVEGDDVASTWEASYNVAPSTSIPAVVESHRTRERRLVLLRWGLVPSFAKDPAVGSRMINARAETVATKPAFRTALRRHRAIVPADGFYEWQAAAGRGPRQPWYVTRADGAPLALAGLWEVWRDPAAGAEAPPLRSCTIITAPASADLDAVHDRMPVVLEAAAWDRWLDPSVDDPAAVADLLVPSPAGTLRRVRVGRAVSSVANDGPALIEPEPGDGSGETSDVRAT